MSYKSDKKGLVVVAVSALVLGTLLSWGALYGLSRNFEPDGQTTGSAVFRGVPDLLKNPPHRARYPISHPSVSRAILNACAAKFSASALVQATSSIRSATFQWYVVR